MTWTKQDDAALARYCRELAADLADSNAEDNTLALWVWLAIAIVVAVAAVAVLVMHDCGGGF